MQFVVVRLGKDSLSDINRLDSSDAARAIPFSFVFICTQVEGGIDIGNYVFVWLGSDNNNGQPTNWKQGLRAIGKITSLRRGVAFNDQSEIEIEVLSVFSRSIDQFDFLENAASYYKYFSKYPVIGVKSSRNNAIQKVNEGDRQRTGALLSALNILFPVFQNQLKKNAPDLLSLLGFVPVGELWSGSESEPVIEDGDKVWAWIASEIFNKQERNFLFLGAPGTGKTWYAHEIAKRLAEGIADRHSFVQFHPSFSYDDFVEGYTPKLNAVTAKVEYSVRPKHFMKLCARAKSDGSNLYVIVIDELTRGDPSRVFGELLTYIEVDHRDREFSLAYSGKKTFIPRNVVIIATANPYDRSVGELDDALVRRFVMRDFPADSNALEGQLKAIGTDASLISRLLHVFKLINNKIPNGFGQAHFWKIRSEDDFRSLWQSRIIFLLKRAFLFDEPSYQSLVQGVEEIFPSSGEDGGRDQAVSSPDIRFDGGEF